jgi:hypothetical protein
MSLQSAPESDGSRALQTRRRIIRLVCRLATGIILPPAILAAAVSSGHAMMLTEWLDSRNASLGDPSYQETFDIRNDSITSFAVSVAVIGLWFLIWLTWYRKAFGVRAASSRR